MLKWKQHLLELGNSPKTINDSKLAALKAIFRWAVDNSCCLQPRNGVSVRRANKKSDMQGFGKEEAATILSELLPNRPNPGTAGFLSCVPSPVLASPKSVSCAARTSRREDGIPYMHFKAEAGSLKNALFRTEGSPFILTLLRPASSTSAAIRQGADFFDPRRRRPGAKRPQPKSWRRTRRQMDTHARHRCGNE